MVCGQVAPPSVDQVRSIAVTPKLSVAVQVMSWMLPVTQLSPPFGESSATCGAIRSSAVPELVKVSTNPLPRTVSTPAGSQVAEMMT